MLFVKNVKNIYVKKVIFLGYFPEWKPYKSMYSRNCLMVKVLFTDNKITKSEVRKVNTKHNYIYIFVNYFFFSFATPVTIPTSQFYFGFFSNFPTILTPLLSWPWSYNSLIFLNQFWPEFRWRLSFLEQTFLIKHINK